MSIGETYLTITGWVGSEVKFKEVNTGVALASFRLGSSPRQFDRSKGAWVDRPTTWFTVECWRTLAQNVHRSLNRGDPVIVNARLKTTEWTEDGEPRSRLVLDAVSVGHDLSRGSTKFTKNQPIHAVSTGSLDDQMRDLSTEAETTDLGTPDETPYTTPEAA